MNLQPIGNMYAPLWEVTCNSCGSRQLSDAAVRDEDSGDNMCLFCADGYDRTARIRQMQAADFQWLRLSSHQRARAIAAKGLPRG